MIRHRERHRMDRIGWLRAAVLGANDGIVSTASLMIGVVAGGAGGSAASSGILLTGIAGLVAGAMSMAAGEYISVHSQADTEHADLERERIELASDPESEHRELSAIYVGRGLEPALAQQVAEQLMTHDALGAHAREELGISTMTTAKPLQAALASASSFSVGAALPIVVTLVAPATHLSYWLAGTALLFLAGLGALAARVGGAGMVSGAWRVTVWGAFAMGITAAAGALFGAIA